MTDLTVLIRIERVQCLAVGQGRSQIRYGHRQFSLQTVRCKLEVSSA